MLCVGILFSFLTLSFHWLQLPLALRLLLL